MPHYKLIACDLDETLLDHDHKIPKCVVEAIACAREQGVRFVPSTGRPFGTIVDVLEWLGVDGCADEYVMSFNGGCLTRNSSPKPLESSAFPHEAAEKIWAYGREHGMCVHAYTLDPVYILNYYDWERAYIEGRMNNVETTASDLGFIQNETITKVLLASLDAAELDAAEAALRNVSGHFGLDVVRSSGRYLEFNPAGVNKGAGLLRLAERLGIAAEDTIAIGDSSNDISMIRAAGLGCCVANATPETLAEADYVCQLDNNAGAVSEVIEKFVLGA